MNGSTKVSRRVCNFYLDPILLGFGLSLTLDEGMSVPSSVPRFIGPIPLLYFTFKMSANFNRREGKYTLITLYIIKFLQLDLLIISETNKKKPKQNCISQAINYDIFASRGFHIIYRLTVFDYQFNFLGVNYSLNSDWSSKICPHFVIYILNRYDDITRLVFGVHISHSYYMFVL